MKHGAKALFVLLLALLVLIGSAQNTGNNALQQYQRIQAEAKNYRYFRNEDGAPRSDRYNTGTDNCGYLWLKTYDPIRYYRFNGTSFVDVFSEFPQAERDSLVASGLTIQQTDAMYQA